MVLILTGLVVSLSNLLFRYLDATYKEEVEEDDEPARPDDGDSNWEDQQ